ncbi:MAG: zinc-ribbon domain-containing protein, partial [bacterium]|nr:zinc-ribbon domain-containing protein [bacterium]
HPEKNGTLTPEKVSTINKRLVWWRCKKGHEWATSVDNRVQGKKKHKCPDCEASG